eukprot:21866-Alexandrium_andersonii.AAC.1
MAEADGCERALSTKTRARSRPSRGNTRRTLPTSKQTRERIERRTAAAAEKGKLKGASARTSTKTRTAPPLTNGD